MKTLLLWVIASALAEVAMLAAVGPFVILISGGAATGSLAGSIQSAGAFFLSSVLLASLFRLSLLRVQAGCTQRIGEYLASRAYQRTLQRPYIDHVNSNTGDIISTLTGKLDISCQLVVASVTVAISSFTMSVAILSALLFMAPWITLGMLLVLSTSYAAFLWRSGPTVTRESALYSRSVSNVARVLTESLGGIRDVLLNGTHAMWARRFAEAQHAMRSAQARLVATSAMPRTIVEAVGFTLIIVCGGVVVGTSGSPASSMAVLAVLVLGLQRLLPVAQGLYGAWHNFKSGLPHLLELLPLLELPVRPMHSPMPLLLQGGLELRDVHYTYPTAPNPVLQGIDLVISKGSFVGIIGESGCGKSTLLDVVMGLLIADRGGVWVDGLKLGTQDASRWRRSTAYVSQSIHLIDGTILENITTAGAGAAVDDEALHSAANQAGLGDFIASLPLGFATHVGERGVRLSGGQRQRVGIARALYTRAEFLVLDEATSSLDVETETSVMSAIAKSVTGLTILMATHRTSTLHHCDEIYRLSRGRLEGPIALCSIVQS